MKAITTLTLASVLTGLLAQTADALEVDREVIPRMTLGGRVIATLDAVDLDSNPDADDGINLDDSTLLMRFDKRLYENGVGGAVVGIKEVEDAILFNQLHVFYWNQDFSSLLGRSRIRNSLIEFPVIRDEDLLSYTHVLNASSNEEFDQLYGDYFAFDWFVDRKIQSLGVWAGTRRNDPDTEFVDAPNGFDSYGAGYVYEQPEDLRYVKWIRHAGVLWDRQKVHGPNDSEWMNALIAGVEVNLNMNPISSWSLSAQAIASDGIDGVTAVDTIAEQAMAKYTSIVTGLRYTARPKLLTRWQTAITFAYKDYSDFDQANQWSVVPNVVYSLGQGVDLLGQVKYTDYGSGLGGGNDTVVQIGASFSLEAMFNDNIGERDSILNLEHGYIK